MASRRAVFVDLDGTLLNNEHTLSSFTKDVLSRLHRTRPEVSLVVATGRPHPHVLELMKVLDLHPDYVVSNNGAVGHRGEAHDVVFEHTLPTDTVRQLLELPLPRGPWQPDMPVPQPTDSDNTEVPLLSANVFRAEEWVTTAMVKGMGASYRLSFHPRVDALLPTTPELWQRVYTFFFYGPHELLLPFETILHDRFADQAVAVFSLPFILDVTPSGIDKGSAVRDVLSYLHLTADDAIAFGDGMNDLPMLTAVRHGYVMANAPDLVKAAVPGLEVIGSNEEDGVAKKLVELFDL